MPQVGARLAGREVILWDFDGTIAYREGLWRSALTHALNEIMPGHEVDSEALRQELTQGFPWHEPERPHPELCRPEAWWARIEGLMAGAFEACGIRTERCDELARRARHQFIDPSTYQLFDDSLPALKELTRRGWRHIILSNHVPELVDICVGLGVADCFEAIITSALTGYEKPHRASYAIGLEAAGEAERVWMVGDNATADVAGAEAVGIPAILVRREGDVKRRAEDFWGVVGIVSGSA